MRKVGFSGACALAAALGLGLLGTEASASLSFFSEPKCGAAVYKAFAKVQQRIRKFSLAHVKGSCDSESAAAVGAELDEAVGPILEKLNQQLDQLQEEGSCDTDLPSPIQASHLLKNDPQLLAPGFSTGQEFLNSEVTSTCDENNTT